MSMHRNEVTERWLIGACLNGHALSMKDVLTVEHFSNETARIVYGTICDILDNDEGLGIVSVIDRIAKSSNSLDPNWMARFLEGCIKDASNYAEWMPVDVLQENINRLIDDHERRIAAKALRKAEVMLQNGAGVADVAHVVTEELSGVGTTSGGPVKLAEHVAPMMADLDLAYTSQGQGMSGISTGFADLDAIIDGWQPSDLVILAARPGMGKTAFVLNALNHASERGIPTAFFSLEMAGKRIAARVMIHRAQVDAYRFRSGRLSEQEWARVIRELKVMGCVSDRNRSEDNSGVLPMWVDEQEALSLADFRARARQLVRKHGVKVIAIDYLQLMTNPALGNRASRESIISSISRGLKGCAKELGITVIALAQLNRDVEKRADKRPLNSDLRESGAIEQDADIISFIYRDEVYNENTEDEGIAELILGKHRNGALGTVRLKFAGHLMTFRNLDPDDDDELELPPESSTSAIPKIPYN